MLSPHVPDLRALELLIVVARTESLSKAAATLQISQQAASSRIRTMESLVGASLLSRSSRGSVLTPNGELLVQWASQVLDAADRLDAGISALRADKRAHLRIASSLTIAEYLLPKWLVSVRSAQEVLGMPPTDFTLTASNSDHVAELVKSDAADLGFIEGPTLPAGLHAALVGVDELVVVVGPQHSWASRRSRPLPASKLAATPLVVREAGSGTRLALERALAGYDMAAPTLTLSSTAAIRSAVEAGAGAAALSAYAVKDDLAAGRLVRIKVSDVELTRRLHAVWTGSRRLPPGPARDLVECSKRLA